MKQLSRITLLLMVSVIAVACRQQAISAENINLDVSVTDSLVGETTLIITVTDDEDNALENPGTLSIRGDMNHAGMTPVIRDTNEASNGVFTVPFEWTMGGAWIVEVTLTLENGDVVTESFEYEILTEASENNDMDDMDHSNMDMDSMDHSSGETSAVYMSITNNGEETITFIGAESEGAGFTELHETIVDNNVARMEPVEMLMIEAGETVDLRPGGIHIMLLNLTQDLVVDETVMITLMLRSGDTIELDAVVQDIMMDDLDNTFESEEITISNIWARPASAGMDMDEMEHDMTEEPAQTQSE